jgi:hypothetical protein
MKLAIAAALLIAAGASWQFRHSVHALESGAFLVLDRWRQCVTLVARQPIEYMPGEPLRFDGADGVAWCADEP